MSAAFSADAVERGLSLAALDAMSIADARGLPFEERDRLLSLILADGRKLLGAQIERQVGLFSDYIEEDFMRLLKVRAVRLSSSGIIPVDARGDTPGDDPIAHYRLAFENLRRTVEGMGSNLARVTSLVIFLADIGDWGRMNAVYREHLRCLPARAVVGASGLNRGYCIEIVNVVAYKVARG